MSKIELRPLLEKEINWLLKRAPKRETRFIRNLQNPVKHLCSQVEQFGILVDDKPIYFWAVEEKNKHYYLWTVVNRNVKHQITMFKVCKRNLDRFNKETGPLYSIMYKGNNTNIEWTKRLGFEQIAEKDNMIMFRRQ